LLLRNPTLMVVQLQFDEHATIDEHAVAWEIDVLCLEGEGFISLDGHDEPIQANQRASWPANSPHRLFTMKSTMTTLMLEHIVPQS
jgi:quercetin dioxygenase-like cupin family protein